MKKTLILLITIIIFIFNIKDIKLLKKIENKDKEIVKQEIEEPKEEILNENINIILPNIIDKCEEDNCITNNFYNSIIDYFKNNNYEELHKDPYIYFRNESNLIKITKDDEIPVEEEINENNQVLTYNFNRYTTIDDLVKILNNQNINMYYGKSAKEVAVINYHFFYDKKNEKCNESICLDITNFENQLKYLKDNNFKTLTINEYKSWIYDEIILPENSVLLTIDDGAMGTSKINGNKLIPLLEKYEINATLFLITGWWDKTNYESNYLDIQSHTHLMHDENQCSNKSRGAELLCSKKEDIKIDLEKSLKEVDNNISFCFPFYLSDNKSIEVLKELDFKIAFVGGNKKSNQKMDKYTLPRYIIYKNTSLNSFISMVN